MKFNKLFSSKSITNLLYGFLLLIPFASILARVIYVQANPNAKDSYSGSTTYLGTKNLKTYIDTTDRTTTSEISINSIITYKAENTNFSGTIQTINYNNFTTGTNSSKVIFNISGLSINNVDYPNAKSIAITRGDGDIFAWVFNSLFDFNNYYLLNTSQSHAEYCNELGDIVVRTDIVFKLVNNYQNVNTDITFTNMEQNIYYNVNTSMTTNFEKDILIVDSNLSSAFEYSLNSFTDSNNLGNVDFFGWFTNLFLNQSNPHNATYINFANWYMNYALLVSSGYLIFMALLWFINYVRRIMDKSMNHDFGGF